MSASSGRPYWDQRDSAESTWQQILHGKPSGTFVVRMSKSSGVEATITMIISAGGDGGGVAVLGSKHTHTSITALVKFYQDPKYFAQGVKLDVPVQLRLPSLSAPSSSNGGEIYEAMWWRTEDGGGGGGGGGAVAAPPVKEEDYGTIYAGGAGGGTLEEQQLYERIVDESAYAICDPYNPLDQLGRTPMMPLTKAVAVLAKFVKGNATADCKKALQYAKTHPQLGKVQRPGGAALTVDDIAAIYMYTMPTNFYGKMNEELGGYGKDAYGKVEHFLPITKLLVAAFEKLPPVLTKLFRGVKMNYKDILKTPGGDNADIKDVVQWNQFTSCSTSQNVLKDSNFLGVGSAGTVFQIITVTGVNIKPFSAIAKEDEVVLPPGSRFVIDAVTPCKDGVTEVRMRQLVGGEDGGDGGVSKPLSPPRPHLQKQLCDAAEASNVGAVRKLLAEGADPSVPDDAYPTFPPVILAAMNGHAECLELLLENNADPNQAMADTGATPMYVAAEKGHVDVMNVLLRNNADPNQAETITGATPVLMAVDTGHVDIVKLLLENNADPNKARTDNGTTATCICALGGHASVLKLLLEFRADLNKATTDHNRTPLYTAVHAGEVEITKILLENKADPNIAKTDGTTPLKKAMRGKNASIISMLKQHGALDGDELAIYREVANIESLKSKWFLPHFSRNQTVDFLRGKPHGSFVIRKSSFRPELEAGGISDPNSTYYAISMKKRDRELWNGLIMHSRGFYSCVLKGNTEFRYNDLSVLVHGLIHNQDLISVAGFPERVRLPYNGTNPFGEPENFTGFSSTPAFAPTTVANGGATSGFDDIYDEPEEENSDDNFDV